MEEQEQRAQLERLSAALSKVTDAAENLRELREEYDRMSEEMFDDGQPTVVEVPGWVLSWIGMRVEVHATAECDEGASGEARVLAAVEVEEGGTRVKLLARSAAALWMAERQSEIVSGREQEGEMFDFACYLVDNFCLSSLERAQGSKPADGENAERRDEIAEAQRRLELFWPIGGDPC